MRHFQYYLNSHSRFAQLLRFASVGATISLIDIGGVYILPWLFSTNIFFARMLSLSMANGTGYVLNRYFTFGATLKGPFFRQMIKHFGVHLIGGLINFSVFSIIIINRSRYTHSDPTWTLLPVIALLAGGLAGMGFNFCFSKRFVFHKRAGKGEVVP